jgi:hypothetical protein
MSRIYKFPNDQFHNMYRRFTEWCQLALNPTKCGVKLSKMTILPRFSRTVPKIGHSPGNFLLEFVPFSIFRFYSVFLIIFFKTETFVDLFSDLLHGNMAIVLRTAQLTVKLKVKYIHDYGVFTVISGLNPYPNRPWKKRSVCKYIILRLQW